MGEDGACLLSVTPASRKYLLACWIKRTMASLTGNSTAKSIGEKVRAYLLSVTHCNLASACVLGPVMVALKHQDHQGAAGDAKK
eukprot:1161079-Pelagomonas_calceolata.AAC.5